MQNQTQGNQKQVQNTVNLNFNFLARQLRDFCNCEKVQVFIYSAIQPLLLECIPFSSVRGDKEHCCQSFADAPQLFTKIFTVLCLLFMLLVKEKHHEIQVFYPRIQRSAQPRARLMTSQSNDYLLTNQTITHPILQMLSSSLNQQLCHCRGSMSHLSIGASKRAKQMRVTTMQSLSQRRITYPASTSPCASLTKQRLCTRTSSENILTMQTVSG